MSKDTLIDKIKSPIIRGELIKHIDSINTEAIAQGIHDHLDIQLVEKDIKLVKQAIKDKLTELIRWLT